MDIWELDVIEERTSQQRRITTEGEEPDDAIEWARQRGFTVYAFRLLGDAEWTRLERAAQAHGAYGAHSGRRTIRPEHAVRAQIAYEGHSARIGPAHIARKPPPPAENTVAMWSVGVGVLAIPLLSFPVGAVLAGFTALVLAVLGFAVAMERRGAGVGYTVTGGILGLLTTLGGLGLLVAHSTSASSPSPLPAPRSPPAQRAVTTRPTAAPAASATPPAPTQRPPWKPERPAHDPETPQPAPSNSPEPPAGSAQASALTAGGVDASSAPLAIGASAHVGDARVRVVDVSLGGVKVQRPGSAEIVDLSIERLLVVIEVAHTGKTGKFEYQTLRGNSGVTLRDDLGRNIRQRPPGLGTPIVGTVESASLRSGEAITDLLIFARPEPDASTLTLTLPFSAFETDASLLFGFEAPHAVADPR